VWVTRRIDIARHWTGCGNGDTSNDHVILGTYVIMRPVLSIRLLRMPGYIAARGCGLSIARWRSPVARTTIYATNLVTENRTSPQDFRRAQVVFAQANLELIFRWVLVVPDEATTFLGPDAAVDLHGFKDYSQPHADRDALVGARVSYDGTSYAVVKPNFIRDGTINVIIVPKFLNSDTEDGRVTGGVTASRVSAGRGSMGYAVCVIDYDAGAHALTAALRPFEHEIGHALGLEHASAQGDPANLMFSPLRTANVLNAAQREAILQSPYVTR
jgi:hypothetical protein